MAERIDGAAILESIRDIAARLSTEKQVANLIDAVKGMQAANEERWQSVERRLKLLDTKIDEITEADRKQLGKVREEIIEAMENIDVTVEGGGSSDEIPKWVAELKEEGKGLFKFLVGDDPKTLDAVRGRVRGWIRKTKEEADGGE